MNSFVLTKEQRALVQAFDLQKLPASMMLVGNAGIGKGEVAEIYARAHLCLSGWANGDACTCISCTLFLNQSHPDYLRVQPKRDGGSISIEQIRQAQEFVGLTANQQGGKAIILDGRLTGSATNGLLKLLEEPPEGVLLIMLSPRAGLLPATIRSRVQIRAAPMPDWDQALSWYQSQHPKIPADQLDEYEILWHLCSGGTIRAANMVRNKKGQLVSDQLNDLQQLMNGKIDASSLAQQWGDKQPDFAIRLCWRLTVDASLTAAGSALPIGLRTEPVSALRRNWLELAEELSTKHSLKALCKLESECCDRLQALDTGGRNKAWLLTGLLLLW
ncbi:MAG: hypothetical protein ACR2PW_06555 [Gammaproteobacteria bacterium]